jgi:hypothetical protein
LNKIHDLKHPVLGHKIEWRDKDHTDIRISIEFERARLRAADLPKALPRLLHLQASAYGKKEKKA